MTRNFTPTGGVRCAIRMLFTVVPTGIHINASVLVSASVGLRVSCKTSVLMVLLVGGDGDVDRLRRTQVFSPVY